MSIRRNTAYNLLGALVPLAVSLVTIPLYLQLIGEARYGVLAIAWLLLGYFGLFDLGLGRATAQRIAALRDASATERAETFWTALAINLGFGIVGALTLWPVATFFFGQVFKIDEALRPELLATVPWLMLAVPMTTVTGVLGGLLQGRERFLDLNLVSVTGTVLFQVLPLSVAAAGHIHLGVLLPAALFARLLTLLLLAFRCWQLLHGHSIVVARGRAGHLLRFGGWVTITAFVGPLMVILDRFIIGTTVGARAVTDYSIPFSLAERSTLLASALTSVLFPRLAALRPEEERRLAHEALRALVVVTTPLTVLGLLLIEPFLGWWISAEFAARSSPVGQLVLLGFWINAFARIPYAQLQARGRPDSVAKCHAAELIPYVVLLYLGLAHLGLAGAAAAFCLRAALDYALLSHIAGSLRASVAIVASPVGLLATAMLIAVGLEPGTSVWLAAILCHLILTCVWSWRQAPPYLKTYGARSRARFEAPEILRHRRKGGDEVCEPECRGMASRLCAGEPAAPAVAIAHPSRTVWPRSLAYLRRIVAVRPAR